MRSGFLVFILLLTGKAWSCYDGKEIPNSYIVLTKTPLVQKLAYAKSHEGLFIEFVGHAPSNNTVLSKSGSQGLYTYTIHTSKDPLDIAKDPNIISVEKNCYVSHQSFDDTLSVNQEYIEQVGVHDSLYEKLLNAKEFVIAISDTGVDLEHEDLRHALWQNHAEINGVDGVDDDNNGCIDDFHGCDFGDNDGDPSPGSSPNAGHGTHVAGIIAAQPNNNLGIRGLYPNAKLMVLKGFPNDSADTRLSDLIRSIYYAVDNGAKIINCSWGSISNVSEAERQAFDYAIQNGVIPVAAAGNYSINVENFSPGALSEIITVGSIDQNDDLSPFSNFGNGVDIYAPGGTTKEFGEGLFSTLPTSNGGYGYSAGTSMSVPIVSAAIAAILNENENLTTDQISNLLRNTADVSSSFEGHLLNTESAIEGASEVALLNQCEFCNAEPIPQLEASENKAAGCGLSGSNNKKGSLPLIIVILFPFLAFSYLRKNS